MKVWELRAALDSCPDDMEILVPGSDHSYNRVDRATHVTARLNRFVEYFEYDPDNKIDDETPVEVVEVVVLT